MSAPQNAAPAPSPPGQGILPLRLLIPWAVLLSLATVLGIGLSEHHPRLPTPLALAHAYRLLAGTELLVLLVVAPLASRAGPAGRRIGLLALLLLPMLAAPAVVIAAWVADAGRAAVLASQGYLLLAALLVSGYLRLDRRERGRTLWWLAVGGLGGGAPLAAFHLGDLFRLELAWLRALSPFWVLDRLCRAWSFDGHWAVPAAALALLAAGLHVRAHTARAT